MTNSIKASCSASSGQSHHWRAKRTSDAPCSLTSCSSSDSFMRVTTTSPAPGSLRSRQFRCGSDRLLACTLERHRTTRVIPKSEKISPLRGEPPTQYHPHTPSTAVPRAIPDSRGHEHGGHGAKGVALGPSVLLALRDGLADCSVLVTRCQAPPSMASPSTQGLLGGPESDATGKGGRSRISCGASDGR